MITPADVGPGASTPAAISPARRFLWSVRRELWENRSLYLAPLAVGALIVAASLVGLIHPPAALRSGSLAPARQQELAEQPFVFAALLLMLTTLVVGIFYSIGALQDERRDRSILFWKSLPVSDLTTVLAKASIPVVLLPLITWAVTVATHGIMLLLLGSARLIGSDAAAAGLWTHVSLLSMSGVLFVHLVFGHGLWWAPLWGWLLMVSAWARRGALLWATLPLLAIGLLEKIAFGTSHLAALLLYRFGGSPGSTPSSASPMSMAGMTLSMGGFLTSAGLWIGLAALGLFIAAAARLRRAAAPA